MIKSIALPEEWIKQINDPKRRMPLFFLSLVLIYFIWFLLLLNPLRIGKNKLMSQMQALQLQITGTQQQIDTINQAVKTQSIAKAIAEQQQLSTKIQDIQQRLAKTNPLFISMEDWIKLKKAIISQQNNMDSHITLVSINDLPVQPWVPTTVDKADVVNTAPGDIYVHELEVKFQADYFNTIQYLSRLEKLPWHVYWDSLQYRVQTYPKGEAIIKFHIFTKQQSES